MTQVQLSSGRQRAMDADEKIERRQAIVDATERLYSRGQVLPGVSEVAQAVGIAKGTFYLYFETKEALYLALHEQHARAFFEALISKLAEPGEFTINDMLFLLDKHMLGNTNFLPLCNVCMGALTSSYNPATHEAFHLQMGTWLSKAGAGLEAHMPRLKAGDGVRLLHHGYGQILGLYQLFGRGPEVGGALHCKPQLPQMGNFRSETAAALRVYWSQALAQGLPPNSHESEP